MKSFKQGRQPGYVSQARIRSYTVRSRIQRDVLARPVPDQLEILTVPARPARPRASWWSVLDDLLSAFIK
jgi:hypothetical protein